MIEQATPVLFELIRRGVGLAVVGDRLRLWPVSALSPDLREAVARHKVQLMAWTLWAAAPPDPAGFWARCASALMSGIDDPDHRAELREAFEHRAAVAEYDGCLSRDEAERIAFAELWTVSYAIPTNRCGA